MKAVYISDEAHKRLKNEAFKRGISMCKLIAEKLEAKSAK